MMANWNVCTMLKPGKMQEVDQEMARYAEKNVKRKAVLQKKERKT
jgi:hypothetical protein